MQHILSLPACVWSSRYWYLIYKCLVFYYRIFVYVSVLSFLLCVYFANYMSMYLFICLSVYLTWHSYCPLSAVRTRSIPSSQSFNHTVIYRYVQQYNCICVYVTRICTAVQLYMYICHTGILTAVQLYMNIKYVLQLCTWTSNYI